MRKIFFALFLYVWISGACFGQITLTGNGNVLTYDVFNAKQQRFQTEITVQPNKDQRVLRLNIEKNAGRKYTFMNEKPFTVYDKYFAMTSDHGKTVDTGARYPLLPINQKIEPGVQWNFSRKGYASICGNWMIAYQAVAKKGPDTSLNMDGTDIAVKTLLIEYRGDATSERCDPYKQTRFVLYAPELNELLMDQWIDFTPDGNSSEFGYKWVLKSVTTTAR